jgi:hypothetical protein
MTESEVVTAIKLAITGTDTDKEGIAKSFLKKAVLKVGRLPSVMWNQTDVEFDLVSGQSSYLIGKDILTKQDDLKNIEQLWRTDTTGEPISVIPVAEFNRYARGSTSSGNPRFATIHSKEKRLEIWPAPSSGYTVWGMVQLEVENFKDIPTEYHDVLIDLAVAFIVATKDARAAMALAKSGIKDIGEDSMTKWTDNVIPLERHVGQSGKGLGPDSGNLRDN